MYYTRMEPLLIVGSQPQSPEDIRRLKHDEGVGAVLNLQQDHDAQYWGIDLHAIRQHCQELGVAHLRCPVSTCGMQGGPCTGDAIRGRPPSAAGLVTCLHVSTLSRVCVPPCVRLLYATKLSLGALFVSSPLPPPSYQARDFDPHSLRTQLPAMVSLIHACTEAGHSVYVHCTAGLGRAPAAAIAFLYWFRDMDVSRGDVVATAPVRSFHFILSHWIPTLSGIAWRESSSPFGFISFHLIVIMTAVLVRLQARHGNLLFEVLPLITAELIAPILLPSFHVILLSFCLQLKAAYEHVTSRRPCGPKWDAIRGATYDLANHHPPHHRPLLEHLPQCAFVDVSQQERELIQHRVRVMAAAAAATGGHGK